MRNEMVDDPTVHVVEVMAETGWAAGRTSVEFVICKVLPKPGWVAGEANSRVTPCFLSL